eukprot:10811251-Alexandrium_andersonii.AAC.1
MPSVNSPASSIPKTRGVNANSTLLGESKESSGGFRNSDAPRASALAPLARGRRARHAMQNLPERPKK